MIRKIILLTLLYFIIGIATFTSCIFTYDTTICDIQFTGINNVWHLENEEPDTFDDQIGFEIIGIEASPTCYIPTIQIFKSAYATTKCANFKNQLLESSYQISLNRAIVLDGETISSNTNLLSISEFNSLTEITITEECKLLTSRIIFTTELTNKIEFESGEYMVTFKCSTSDEKELTKTRKVIFKG